MGISLVLTFFMMAPVAIDMAHAAVQSAPAPVPAPAPAPDDLGAVVKELAPQFRKLAKQMPDAARRGALVGALRARALLIKATGLAPPANQDSVGVGGAVNTGFYRNSWKAEATPDGAHVFNDAKYAGVIEYGRRKNSRFPPVAVIQNWAMRRMGLSAKEAKRAAFPIARAIAKRGLLARRVLTDSVDTITEFFIEAVEKSLKAALKKAGHK
jgi:hypothetical protein